MRKELTNFHFQQVLMSKVGNAAIKPLLFCKLPLPFAVNDGGYKTSTLKTKVIKYNLIKLSFWFGIYKSYKHRILQDIYG